MVFFDLLLVLAGLAAQGFGASDIFRARVPQAWQQHKLEREGGERAEKDIPKCGKTHKTTRRKREILIFYLAIV